MILQKLYPGLQGEKERLKFLQTASEHDNAEKPNDPLTTFL